MHQVISTTSRPWTMSMRVGSSVAPLGSCCSLAVLGYPRRHSIEVCRHRVDLWWVSKGSRNVRGGGGIMIDTQSKVYKRVFTKVHHWCTRCTTTCATIEESIMTQHLTNFRTSLPLISEASQSLIHNQPCISCRLHTLLGTGTID